MFPLFLNTFSSIHTEKEERKFNQVGEISRRATNRQAENIRDMCIIREQAEMEFTHDHCSGSDSYTDVTGNIRKFSRKIGKKRHRFTRNAYGDYAPPPDEGKILLIIFLKKVKTVFKK